MSDAKLNYSKLTPAYLKRMFDMEIELIAKHEQMARTIYEMMASLAFHAPLMRPCTVRSYLLKGLVIEQPAHWLVYSPQDKNRVRAHAEGTLDPVSVPPRPIGFMIPSGRVKTVRTPHNPDGEQAPLYLALWGKTLLGEWPAARCVTEITARQ